MPNSTMPLICVDSSVVLPLVIEHPLSDVALNQWQGWKTENCRFVAPTLLHYEITNVLHRYCVAGLFSQITTYTSLQAALVLQIMLYDDNALHYSARNIALTHKLPATYDAYYLALSERLGAEFWTADRRLFNRVHEELPWVHCLGAS